MADTFVLGSSPVLVARGQDLAVEGAYMTSDGRWHEIVLSNGFDLGTLQGNNRELARKIQEIWAASVESAQGSTGFNRVLTPSSVHFSLLSRTTRVTLETETEPEYQVGSFIELSAPLFDAGHPVGTVHGAMQYLQHLLLPQRVEHGPLEVRSESTPTPAPTPPPTRPTPPAPTPAPAEAEEVHDEPVEESIDSSLIDPHPNEFIADRLYATRFKPLFTELFECWPKGFPFEDNWVQSNWRCSAEDYIEHPSRLPSSQRHRIQDALIDYSRNKPGTEQVGKFLIFVKDYVTRLGLNPRDLVRYLLLILREKEAEEADTPSQRGNWLGAIYRGIYSRLGI